MPPNKTPQYGSPLLAILRGGKQAVKPPVFGVTQQPTFPTQPLPQAPLSTPQTAVRPAQTVVPPQMTPYTPPVQAVNPLDIIRKGKEQSITQGIERDFWTTPIPGNTRIFGGTGRAEMPAENESIRQTMSRVIKEKGLLPAVSNLLFEGFTGRFSPNPEQYIRRNEERINKLLEAGVVSSKEEAGRVAAQDVYDNTDLKGIPTNRFNAGTNVPQQSLGIELTDEQKKVLRFINLKERLFAVVDAPVFGLTTAVPKTALKTYAKKVAADMVPDDRVLIDELAQGNWVNPLQKKRVLEDFRLTKASDGEVSEFFTEVKKELDTRWGGVEEALNPPVQPNRPGAMDIKKPAPDKAPQPKDFKTAEEYIDQIAERVFHGGSFRGEIDFGKTSFGDAFFVSDSSKYAGSHGGKNSKLTEFGLLKSAKMLDTTKTQSSVIKTIKQRLEGTPTGKTVTIPRPDGTKIVLPETPSDAVSLYPYGNKQVLEGLQKGNPVIWEHPEIQKILKTMGYDGLITRESTAGKNIAVFNPKILKTRTQLLDEWKKANASTNPTPHNRDYPGLRSQGGYIANPFKVTDKGVTPTSPRVPNAGNPAAFDRAANGLMKESWTKLREVVQDNWLRAKNLQRTPGVKVEKGADPYLAETLFHGRVHTRLQEVKDNVIKIDKDIVATAKKFNTNNEELTRAVNKYLQATHAPERNARLGDGAAGITTKEADEFIASVNASSLGKEVRRVTDELLELNRRTLTTLKEAQVIDDQTFKTLTETYKNHVPLNRIMDTTEDITQALSGRGFSVRGSGIKRATGSDREVADIITNITTNVEQAIIRAEKNLVDLQTLKFARNNKDLGLFEEIKPKAVGLDFEGKPIMQQITDPQVLVMRENGKPVYLKINDPHMAAMYQNVNLEHIPNMMQWIATFTRLYSSLHTRFNYEFAFSNKLRDIQEMAVDMASRKEMGFKQAGRAMTREPESIKAVTDFIRGADTEGARLYKQMQMDGGTTGGLSLSTRKQVEVDIEKIRQLNRSQPRRAARMLLEAVDNWNTIFEDSTRLSVYKTALKNGSDRETAAMLAKESTVNFNKKGTGGSVINGLYMFSNASIQGTTKMLRAMKNPKVAGAVVGGMGLAVYNLNKFNDSVDPDWRDKVTEYDRTSNMVLFLPSDTGEAKYITIPVSWGLKPIKVAMEHTNDFMTGHNDDVPDAIRGIMIAAATSYNPLAGSESVVETLTPTFLKTPQEIASNTAWHGGKIRPDYDPNMPKSAQFFDSLERKATGRVAIDATEKLADATGGEIQISPANINYAFEAYIGGLGRSVTKILNTITSIGKGEDLKPSEIPIASRFFKVRDIEQTESQRIYGVLDEERKERSQGVYDADRLFRDLKELPSEEQKARLKEIAVEDPDLLKQLETRYKKDRWTPQERALAGLTNASKAQYLLTRLPEIPKEERRQYIAELLERGVISENVIKEMETQRGIIEQ